jgi:hypothetical protein
VARCLIFALGLTLLVAACADDEPSFDPAIITQAVQAELDPIGVETATCEELDVDSEVIAELPEFGGVVDCVGMLNDDPVDVLVTVGPAIEGQITVAAEVLTDLFDVAAAERAAADRLDVDLGGSPVVSCAERLVVAAAGRRVECRVTAEGGTAGPVDRVLTIVLVDGDGNWEIELFNSPQG